MTLEQLRGLLAGAQKRAADALDKINTADESADLAALETELDEAVAEVERTRQNLETRSRQEAVLARDAVVPPVVERQFAAPAGGQRAERVYRPDAGSSFFGDLLRAKQGDHASLERLQRSNHEWAVEKRAGINQTATSGGEFSPPLWLDDYAPLLRAGRPTMDAIGTLPLPPSTNSINLPKITTGDSVAVQTDGGAVSNTDLVTTTVTAQVQTEAGRAVASYQIVDLSSPAIDGVLYQDLTADYARNTDASVINGAVTNAKGILNITGVNAVTYTTATPKQVDSTVANSFWYQIILAKNAIEKGAFDAVTFAVMHPSTWNWYLSGLDSQNRPLATSLTGLPGFNGTAQNDTTRGQSFVGNVFGLPVVADANVPVNLGAGTNQAPTILMNARGYNIWESQPVFKVADQTSITTLQYQFVLYGYYAVMSRQPKMISVINGTGSIVQSGF